MNTFLKFQQNGDILYRRERNLLKTTDQVTHVINLHAILFRMYERGTATEKK